MPTLTDEDLELRVTNYTDAEVRIWRNPATASEAVAYRTWRIDAVPVATELQIETKQPDGIPGEADFCIGSALEHWGTGDGTWPDFLPVFPLPVEDWKRCKAELSNGILSAKIVAIPEPFLVVLATGAREYSKSSPIEHLTTARTWKGEPFFCPDESVEIDNNHVRPCNAPTGKTAIIVPAPPNDVSLEVWSSLAEGGERKKLVGETQITRRWNGKKQRFERVAVVIVKKEDWPFANNGGGLHRGESARISSIRGPTISRTGLERVASSARTGSRKAHLRAGR